MNPSLRFLGGSASLADQVAQCMADALTAGSGNPDSSGVEIWVPTAGAGRSIKGALRKLPGGGFFPSRVCAPMEALLRTPHADSIASRSERETAWLRSLELLDETAREALLPRDFDPADAARALGFAGVLCDLEDLLAEGALWPGDARIPEECPGDLERWEALAGATRTTREILAEAGLHDPNQLRLDTIEGIGSAVSVPKHLFIAAIPDLPRAAELLAAKWLAAGTSVTVLVWMPPGLPAGFDAWGRPVPEDWNAAPVSIADEQIRVFATPRDEARDIMTSFSRDATAPGIVVPDSALIPDLKAAAAACGVRVFAPGGMALSLTEPGRIASLWTDWLLGGKFSTLRHLLALPTFLEEMHKRMGESSEGPGLLQLAEYLAVQGLADHLSAAVLLLEEPDAGFHREEVATRLRARKFVGVLNQMRLSVADLLRILYPVPEENAPASMILDLIAQLERSGLLAADEQGSLLSRLLRRVLARERIHSPAPDGSVVLNGWLEAPWLPPGPIRIAGCQDAVLPGVTRGHAFLPDSARGALGLPTQAMRRARDAYLLQALCNARATADFVCSFSQQGADASPALPSSLLLRGAPEDLPLRIRAMFAAIPSPPRPRRETAWKWELPARWRKPPPGKISPTDFSQYLRCPLRYYFGRVLGAEPFDPLAMEMDARQFGTLVHDALEHFALNHPELADAKKIEDCLLETLDLRARRMFGSRPAGAVLVQLEAIRVRLRAFARLQAGERAAGWHILVAERKLSASDPDPLILGGLPVSAKIDRIDRHDDGTLRILDYKTTASPKKPGETHFGKPTPPSHVHAAHVEIGGKEKVWADLQLPLYRMIAEKWYPGSPRIEVGYVILPADPARTAVMPLELDDALVASARACAVEVASHVRLGHFWPPGPWPRAWEDPLDSILGGARAEDCFSAESIQFLEGAK